MYDKDALQGKTLAELREIGRQFGIKAQMRKQELQTRYSNYPPASNRPFLNPHPMPNCRSNRQV